MERTLSETCGCSSVLERVLVVSGGVVARAATTFGGSGGVVDCAPATCGGIVEQVERVPTMDVGREDSG